MDPHPSSTSPEKSRLLQRWSERGFIASASDLVTTEQYLKCTSQPRLYVGYDPTGDSLHVGHLVTLMALRWAQRCGVQPILISGSATAPIGDPSAPGNSRVGLTPCLVQSNSKAIFDQARKILQPQDHQSSLSPIVLDNAQWLSHCNHLDFIRDIGRHFTVNRMIATKTYRRRLSRERSLTFWEFNYQVLQAYDYLHVFRHHQCALQLGGGDQWGNMIAGVELIRRSKAAMEPPAKSPSTESPPLSAQCITVPLVTTHDGKKMGKSKQGCIWLDPNKTTPFDYYQYWLNRDDSEISKLLKWFTELPLNEVEQLSATNKIDWREAKIRLATEATQLIHGEEEANRAMKASLQAFGGSADWSALRNKEVESPEINITDLLVHPNIEAFSSKRVARSRIRAGAIEIDGISVLDPNHMLRSADHPHAFRLRIGKKKRICVKLGIVSETSRCSANFEESNRIITPIASKK